MRGNARTAVDLISKRLKWIFFVATARRSAGSAPWRQVIGQALIAAQRTVDPERHVHSLHAYFVRPGDPAIPIIYEVDRIRDGSSFSTRRVLAKHARQGDLYAFRFLPDR